MIIILCSQLFWVAINSEWLIKLLRKNLQECMTGQYILSIWGLDLLSKHFIICFKWLHLSNLREIGDWQPTDQL